MAVRITVESFQQLWDQWETLLPQGAFRSIFQTPLWHHVWWQELGGQAELYLTSLRENGALVGIAFAGAFPEAIWAAAIAASVAFFASIGANGIAGSP